jgi:hypothetical protein
MRKKIIAFFMSMICAISLSACADNSQVQSDNTQLWESPLGYSITYDSSAFTLESDDTSDRFTCVTQEPLDAPVYIAVQSYPDMDVTTLADGLILQSGIDGLTAEDTYFGADSIETKNVYIEKEVVGITQVQVFYAIPVGEGSLLVEIGSYVGVPQTIDGMIEEMLGTFKIPMTNKDK